MSASTSSSMCSMPISTRASTMPGPSHRPLFDLTGRVALVTGASRGLGLAMAQVARRRRRARRAQRARCADPRAAPAGPRRCRPPRGDGARSTSPTRAPPSPRSKRSARRHGRLDILVSNAGSIVRKPLLEQSEEDWRSIVDADLTAGWRLAREAARLMIEERHGRIVFVSSIMGRSRGRASRATSPQRPALNGLVRALAVELAPHGITVNAIAPGLLSDRGQQRSQARQTRVSKGGSPRARRWHAGGGSTNSAPRRSISPRRAAGYTTGTVLTVDGGLTASL